MTYIGGYIVRRIRDKVCEESRSKVSSSICPEDPNHAFLSIKNYSGAKEGLLAPSTSLVLALEQMETEYQRIIGDVIHSPRVKASLVQALGKYIPNQLQCSSCHLQLLILHLMINIRLHHTIKRNNIMLRDETTHKNRKTLKFSHL